jgi:hypothetical protein
LAKPIAPATLLGSMINEVKSEWVSQLALSSELIVRPLKYLLS